MAHKMSKLEKQLSTLEGQLDSYLDRILAEGIPHMKRALGVLACARQSKEPDPSALRNLRLEVRMLSSLCRAQRNGRLTKAQEGRYAKVLRRFRPLAARIEQIGVTLPPAVKDECISIPVPPKTYPLPRPMLLEVTIQLVRRLGWPSGSNWWGKWS
jgi:hypothetical protein